MRCLDAPQWLQDPRYATEKLRVASRAPLNEALARRFRQASVAHWVELLNRAGVPAGPVYTIPRYSRTNRCGTWAWRSP